MAYKFFQIPITAIPDTEAALNQFLANHRIVKIEKQWVANGEHSFWAICVEYLGKTEASVPSRKTPVDYKEVLSESDFEMYSALRKLRDQIADEESVRRYVIFRNDQLAEMAVQRVQSLDALEAIPGVGKGRVEKYGERFLAVIREEGGKP